MGNRIAIAAAACLCLSCASVERGKDAPSIDSLTRAALDAVLDDLAAAANTVKPELAERHLLLDDERFTEIEDFIPEPLGASAVREIHAWLRKNGKPGDHVGFSDRRYYRLTGDVAYATAVQHLRFDKPGRSRVTLLFVRNGGRWKIIHAHYSAMPKREE